MNKILFAVSGLGLVISTLFMVISVWNTKWILLEKGYYTFGVLTVAVMVYLAVQMALSFMEANAVGKLNTALTVAFAFVAVVFMAISIRNTEWILLEKGYYWMGLAFVAITSAMVSATISSVIEPEKSSSYKSQTN